MTGTVYLVGAGPGAPDLLTVRAARPARARRHRLPRRARASGHARARNARRENRRRQALRQALDGATLHQQATRRRRAHARDRRAGSRAAIPMLFGRAQEEIAALEAAGVPYEVVPGITAALAAAADIGTSLTQRGGVRSFAFVTPRVGAGEPPSRWLDGMLGADAGAIYMGSHDAPAIAAALSTAGRVRQRRSQSSKTPRCRLRVCITRRSLRCRASQSVIPAVRRCCSSDRSSARAERDTSKRRHPTASPPSPGVSGTHVASSSHDAAASDAGRSGDVSAPYARYHCQWPRPMPAARGRLPRLPVFRSSISHLEQQRAWLAQRLARPAPPCRAGIERRVPPAGPRRQDDPRRRAGACRQSPRRTAVATHPAQRRSCRSSRADQLPRRPPGSGRRRSRGGRAARNRPKRSACPPRASTCSVICRRTRPSPATACCRSSVGSSRRSTSTPDPVEVADVFEVPLDFLLDTANHQRHHRMLGEIRRDYWAIPWLDRYIWGATAAMLLILERTLSAPD